MSRTLQKFFSTGMLCLGLLTQNLAAGVSFTPPGQSMTPGGGWVIFKADNPTHMLRIFPGGHFQYRNGNAFALANWCNDPEGFLDRLRTFTQGAVGNALSLLQPLFFNIENSVRSLTPQTVFQALEAFYTKNFGQIPTPIAFQPLITVDLHQVIINLQDGPSPSTLMLNTGPGAPAQEYILLLIQFGLFSNDQLTYLAFNPTINALFQVLQNLTNPSLVQLSSITPVLAVAAENEPNAPEDGEGMVTERVVNRAAVANPPHVITLPAFQVTASPALLKMMAHLFLCALFYLHHYPQAPSGSRPQ